MARESAPDATYRQYTFSILTNTGYRATWLPNERMELGAIGFLLENGKFDQRADLSDLDVKWKRKPNRSTTTVEYQSSSGVTQTVKIAGDEKGLFEAVGTASAGVRYDFSRAGAIVFSAPQCEIDEIDDKRNLERQLQTISGWESQWIVVTKVVLAKQTTILVSGDKGAFVELRASGSIAPSGVEIAEIAAGFQKAKHSNMSIHLVSQGNLSPLYEAHRLIKPRRGRDRRGKLSLI
jgi:hypothetical protein